MRPSVCVLCNDRVIKRLSSGPGQLTSARAETSKRAVCHLRHNHRLASLARLRETQSDARPKGAGAISGLERAQTSLLHWPGPADSSAARKHLRDAAALTLAHARRRHVPLGRRQFEPRVACARRPPERALFFARSLARLDVGRRRRRRQRRRRRRSSSSRARVRRARLGSGPELLLARTLCPLPTLVHINYSLPTTLNLFGFIFAPCRPIARHCLFSKTH